MRSSDKKNPDKKLSEKYLLDTYLRPLCDSRTARNLEDDSARLPRGDYIITTDNAAEGRHFFADTAPHHIAARLMARNLSDIAASAARPLYYLLNWVLTDAQDEAWIAEFCNALAMWQERYGIRLIGGDATHGDNLVLVATMLGEPLLSPSPLRSTAKSGDILCVTGAIGSAFLGLQALRGEAPQLSESALAVCRERFLNPEPRCLWSAKIVDFLEHDLHSLIDISDGLALDAERIALASGVSADIDLDKIPLLPAVAELCAMDGGLLLRLMSGGDDYELLFSVAPQRAPKFLQFCRAEEIAVTEIGKLTAITEESPQVRYFRHGEEIELIHKGWDSFSP